MKYFCVPLSYLSLCQMHGGKECFTSQIFKKDVNTKYRVADMYGNDRLLSKIYKILQKVKYKSYRVFKCVSACNI